MKNFLMKLECFSFSFGEVGLDLKKKRKKKSIAGLALFS